MKDGSKYEGQWENHLMNGKGIFTDSDGVIWEGIFVNGNYESKDQKQLQIEIAKKEKTERILKNSMEFFSEFIDAYTNSDKKTLKENIQKFFPSTEAIEAFVSEPYTKFEDKPVDKWNEVILLIKECNSKKITVLENAGFSNFVAPDKIKAKQFTEGEGQIVEILIERANNEKLKMSLIKNKEGKWLILFYEDNFPELLTHKKK